MSDPRPRYPKGQRLEMDPRDVWAATRRPPNVSEALTSTFSDLYWKTYAIVHHAGRVVELDQGVQRGCREPQTTAWVGGNRSDMQLSDAFRVRGHARRSLRSTKPACPSRDRE